MIKPDEVILPAGVERHIKMNDDDLVEVSDQSGVQTFRKVLIKGASSLAPSRVAAIVTDAELLCAKPKVSPMDAPLGTLFSLGNMEANRLLIALPNGERALLSTRSHVVQWRSGWGSPDDDYILYEPKTEPTELLCRYGSKAPAIGAQHDRVVTVENGVFTVRTLGGTLTARGTVPGATKLSELPRKFALPHLGMSLGTRMRYILEDPK